MTVCLPLAVTVQWMIGGWFNYDWHYPPWDSNKNKIKTVVIDNGVTTIGNCAFLECYYLTSVNISNSVRVIGDFAFYFCYRLFASISIFSSIRIIGDWAFAYCHQLTSINLSDSVWRIGEGAFGGCGRLTSIDVDIMNPMYGSNDGILYNKEQTVLVKKKLL